MIGTVARDARPMPGLALRAAHRYRLPGGSRSSAPAMAGPRATPRSATTACSDLPTRSIRTSGRACTTWDSAAATCLKARTAPASTPSMAFWTTTRPRSKASTNSSSASTSAAARWACSRSRLLPPISHWRSLLAPNYASSRSKSRVPAASSSKTRRMAWTCSGFPS